VSEVVEFTADNEVILKCSQSGGETIVKASFVVVLIGAQPDLSFLTADTLGSLGVVRDAPIESKHNPVDVDPITYQSNRFPGLYAMGPLVGDNFVRFLQGGALGIAAHVWQKREELAAALRERERAKKEEREIAFREKGGQSDEIVERRGKGDGQRNFKLMLRMNALLNK